MKKYIVSIIISLIILSIFGLLMWEVWFDISFRLKIVGIIVYLAFGLLPIYGQYCDTR